ncbi:MAG TPA: M28 family metallopeptidase [Candidatus Acidoferrum sp.]|nr:M28 family metallopeptidase [Candidatus Acidoferrum sp.]
MRRSFVFSILVFVVLAFILLRYSPLALAQSVSPIPPDAQAAMGELQKEPFRAHMAFLADDLLEGRGTGARGHEIAARYVAAQFEAIGLKPAGQDGTYFQRVPFRQLTVEPEKCAVSIAENGSTTQLKWGDDFLMRGNEVYPDSSIEARVVFVGYGVRTPDGSYDDYAGVDVKGKIVAMFGGAPPSLPSELQAHLSALREKWRNARDHGAIGVITLRKPKDDKGLPWPRVVIGAGFPAMRWLGPDGVPGDAYPELRARAGLSVAASERLFQDASKSWADVLRDAELSKPQSFALPVTAKLRQVSRHEAISSPNVIAVLPGSDPNLRQDYVVYSAHVDHLGIGKPINGDSIYNGAADNASGTAALLVIAKAFKSMAQPPARSIMFLGTTAEETGLLGSDYFAHFPTVPIKSIVADINMDGASVFYTFNDIIALGAPDSSLDAVVARNAARLGLKVTPDPEPDQHYFVRADQYSFVRQGVPSVFISEGEEAKDPAVDGKKFTEQWIATRYHAPSDDMNQPLNFDAAVQFMQIDFLVGYDIAQDLQRPKWKPGDFFGENFGPKN